MEAALEVGGKTLRDSGCKLTKGNKRSHQEEQL